MIDLRYSIPSNSPEINNAFLDNVLAGKLTKLTRKNEHLGTRKFRSIYTDSDMNYYISYAAAGEADYNLKDGLPPKNIYTPEINKFANDFETRALREINTYRDLQVLGYNTPNLRFTSFSKSTVQKPYRNEQTNERHLKVQQNVFSLFSIPEVKARTLREISKDNSIPLIKRSKLVDDFFQYGFILALALKDPDGLQAGNAFVMDIDQPRPKDFCTIDHDDAQGFSLDHVMAFCKKNYLLRFENNDWEQTSKGLVDFMRNVHDSRPKLSPAADLYIANCMEALEYIYKEKYKNVDVSILEYTP